MEKFRWWAVIVWAREAMRQLTLSRTTPIEAVHVWPPNFGGYVFTEDIERGANITIVAAADDTNEPDMFACCLC